MTDLIIELRRIMSAQDGDRELMYQAGREFLISQQPHQDMLLATAELGRILKLDWGTPNDQEPWMADR